MIEVLHRASMPLSALHALSSPLQALPFPSPPLHPADHTASTSALTRKNNTCGLPWPQRLNQDALPRSSCHPAKAFTPPHSSRPNATQVAPMASAPSYGPSGPGAPDARAVVYYPRNSTYGQPASSHHEAPADHSVHQTEQDAGHRPDEIASYLQIPSSINSSKASLSELAAQVGSPASSKRPAVTHGACRSPVCSGSNLRKRYTASKGRGTHRVRLLHSCPRPSPRCRSGSGSQRCWLRRKSTRT